MSSITPVSPISSISTPDTVRIIAQLADELKVRAAQVAAAVDLLDDGATVPFIARYRKEVTGGLDDTVLRELEVRLSYLRELEARRLAIFESITQQGKLTPELEREIAAADTKQRLEDLYAPYKPKRRTRAQIAREAGLEPLADAILADAGCDPAALAANYLNPEASITDAKAALDGARDILAERYAENADLLAHMREHLWNTGVLYSKVAEGKEAEGANFRDWFDFNEPLRTLPSHRVLALLRGRQQGVLELRVGLRAELEAETPHPCVARIAAFLGLDGNDPHAAPSGLLPPKGAQSALGRPGGEGNDPHAAPSGLLPPKGAQSALGRPGGALDLFSLNAPPRARWLGEVCRWTWRVKLLTAFESEFFGKLRDEAEAEAIRVFAANLKDLLLAAPAGPKAVLGLDPGIRTGCKIAVIDKTGKVVDTATVYPFEPRRDVEGAINTLAALCARHKVELVAIGNGTASRESEKLVGEMMARFKDLKLTRVVVSEAGASVYSASETAAAEFPNLDVTLRGAVSIARRLQDPLAELVKIDPKAIGVGQYQHDLNQRELARSLDAVVEDCVNAVGVDVNTASAALLARVSGLSNLLAKNIVAWRDEHGAFASRAKLMDVPRFGDKAFEQAAGFLRIPNGVNPLDASAVHPEAYPVVQRILARVQKDMKDIIGQREALKGVSPSDFTDERFGLPTVRDIFNELEKPGRDPRPEFKTAKFKEGIETLKDLMPGMVLEGVVTNVANFGAFVDIGVHQDGLVHISALSEKFVKDPRDVVRVGQTVTVKVQEVDVARQRVALTMRLNDAAEPARRGDGGAMASRGQGGGFASRGQGGNGGSGSGGGQNKPRADTGRGAPVNSAMADAFAKLKR